MACGGSSGSSSLKDCLKTNQDKTNFTRLTRLLICGGTVVIRELFDSIIPPTNLANVLMTSKTKLKQLRTRRILTQPQWDLLYPSSGTPVESKSFDITLLFILLREYGLTPPATGWKNLPNTTDITLEADLVRITYYCNEIYGHVTRVELNERDFQNYGQKIKDAIVRLAQYTFGSSSALKFEETIKNYLGAPLTLDDINIKEILLASDKLDKISNQMDELIGRKNADNEPPESVGLKTIGAAAKSEKLPEDTKVLTNVSNKNIISQVMEDDLQNETSHGTIINFEISCDAVQNKNKKSVIIKDACSSICALLNSHRGGNVKLSSSQNLNPILDELVRGIEQHLNMFLGVRSLIESSRVETKDCGKEIIFSIKPSDRIVTMGYNLCLPTDFQVIQVPGIEPLEDVARLLKPGRLINSNLQEYVKEFQKDRKVPDELRESDTVQFKKIKSERNTNKTLADRIITQNKITHYVSAFANHKGGHVYVGIDDETHEVCGQSVDDKEQKRISEKVGSAINDMLWPVEHGKPERGKHWDICFIPVLDSNREEIPGLYVIVISIARCPGGVFLNAPESYVIENRKVVMRMDSEKWKKKVLHDAHIQRENCRENSWKKTKALSMPTPGDKSMSEAKLSDSSKGKEDSQRTHPIECEIIPRTTSRIVPRNSKSRTQCLNITDIMEKHIEDGDFAKVQQFASEVFLKIKGFQKPDIEVAVHFNLALAYYREWKFEEAYQELSKASNLISATENAAEFEIQKLHLLACFRRGKGQYEKSYEVTCGGLQKLECISPCWYSAWMLSGAGYLFSILAERERNEEVRQSFRQQAVKLYTQAIEHTAKFDEDSSKQSRKLDTAKFNLLDRCHLRLAMLFLGCAPVAEVDDVTHVVTDEDLNKAIANVRVVEESILTGDSLTDVNKFYLCLVRSDLSYRRSQKNVEEWERHHKEAVKWAADARELAIKYNIHGIRKYADSRLDRLSKVKCYSRAEKKQLKSCWLS